MHKSYLIIDGYNVIHAWRLLEKWQDDMAAARDELISTAADYSAYRDMTAIVVYDAPSAVGMETEEFISGITVVFTNEDETADSYIERTAYRLVREGAEVFVVTSDGMEQSVILGAGAYRISAREWKSMITQTQKQRREKWQSRPLGDRSELAARLSDDMLEKLESLRRMEIRSSIKGKK